MSSYTESVFVDKFDWGEDWQADHSQVVELIDITHLTMGVIHLLVTILRSLGLSVKKIFDFLNEQVLPSKMFKMNSKMFTNLYVKCFENKKVRVNLCGNEFWERQFFKPDDFENCDQEGGGGGVLGAGGSPTPEPYIPSRCVLSKK